MIYKMTGKPYEYGRTSKMADIPIRRIFQNGGLSTNQYGENFNIANIPIGRKISQYDNTNNDSRLIETNGIDTADHLRVYCNRVSSSSFVAWKTDEQDLGRAPYFVNLPQRVIGATWRGFYMGTLFMSFP